MNLKKVSETLSQNFFESPKKFSLVPSQMLDPFFKHSINLVFNHLKGIHFISSITYVSQLQNRLTASCFCLLVYISWFPIAVTKYVREHLVATTVSKASITG